MTDAAHAGRLRAAATTPLVRGVVGGLLFLALAEAFTRSGIVDPANLPYVSSVLGEVIDLFGNAAFRADIWATVYAWMISIGLAVLIAVPFGLVLGSSNATYRATSAVVEVMRPIPAVAMIPLAVLVWGQGTLTKVILAVFATVWPILYNTIYGVHAVDPVAVRTARTFGLPRRAIVRRVLLPSVAPFALTGIRVAASIGLIVIIGTELVAGTPSGIGSYIFQIRVSGVDAEVVLAAAAIAGMLGVLINLLFGLVERKAFGWATKGEGR